MKSTRIHRLLRLLAILQTGQSFGVHDLMRELKVSRRTVFRDLEAMSRAGIPCFYDDESKSYRLEAAFFLPAVHFTLSEALALLLAARRFASRQVSPNFEAATQAALKLENLLPHEIQQQCGSLLETVEVRWPPTAQADALHRTFETIQRAIQARHKVRMQYDSYYEQSEIDVVLHPYKLAFISRAWYVIGFSEMHDEPRTFKLERMISADVLDEPFLLPDDFSLKDYFGNAWQMIRGDKTYHVRIRFSPLVAGNVEEVLWHRTQQTQRYDDGSMTFEVDVDGLDEIKWWVLGYGKEAEVESPPELRERIREHVRVLQALYADGRDRP